MDLVDSCMIGSDCVDRHISLVSHGMRDQVQEEARLFAINMLVLFRNRVYTLGFLETSKKVSGHTLLEYITCMHWDYRCPQHMRLALANSIDTAFYTVKHLCMCWSVTCLLLSKNVIRS